MNLKEKRRHISGITGTIIFHAVLLILLYIFGFRQLIPDTEEGILINFGDSPTGTGNIEPKSAPVVRNTPPPPPPQTTTPKVSTPTTSDGEKLNTQDFEESVAMKSAEEKRKKEEAKKRKQLEDDAKRKKQEELAEKQRLEAIEAEKQRKLEEERVRLEQERLERERLEQEEREAKARQAEAINKRTANVFAAAGKAAGNSTSEGDTIGTGNQGSPNGDPNSTSRTGSGLGTSGNSYSLAGRSLIGTLPSPVYNIQEEGIVVVQIEVDRNGRVMSATPILRGSTTQNSQLWQKARDAAMRAKFNANPAATSKQLGTITYHFQLD